MCQCYFSAVCTDLRQEVKQALKVLPTVIYRWLCSSNESSGFGRGLSSKGRLRPDHDKTSRKQRSGWHLPDDNDSRVRLNHSSVRESQCQTPDRLLTTPPHPSPLPLPTQRTPPPLSRFFLFPQVGRVQTALSGKTPNINKRQGRGGGCGGRGRHEIRPLRHGSSTAVRGGGVLYGRRGDLQMRELQVRGTRALISSGFCTHTYNTRWQFPRSHLSEVVGEEPVCPIAKSFVASSCLFFVVVPQEVGKPSWP